MPTIIFWAVPVFVGLLALEFFWFRQRPKSAARGYETADTWASLSMGVGNLLTATAWKAVAVGLLFGVYEWRINTVPMQAWWAWGLLVLADDFVYYWFHRFGHRVRLGWAAHVNHHSSSYYNLSTALRQSWTGPFLKVWFYLPLAFLGFHPLMILTGQAISLIYQFWIHTEVIHRLPRPVEWLFNTPSHHRVHHGSNPQYLDKNYAGIFIIWDRLFGTFIAETEPVQYGLTKPLQSRNPFWIAFHEWIFMLKHVWHAKHWKNKLGYLLMPPDWDAKEADEPELHLQSKSGA
ncbi:MAG: sterol desaturase family protein [Oceanococcus sp.]